MNLSALEVADVPPGVVTRTSTTPATSGGATAVSPPAPSGVNDVAATVPKVTPVTPARPAPVTVTGVPPVVGPLGGDRPVTAGT